MDEILKRALEAKQGEKVTSLYKSDGPYVMTKDKEYEILGVSPSWTRNAEGKGESINNVSLSIRDDSGKISHVPYILFKEYN